MASSSSSSRSSPASSSRACNYDVFLSFRGEDVRKTFVDHLYNALINRQISTYKDDQTLPVGESVGPSLFKAIEESKIAVIVFSKNYADSSWCLEEVAYIMKCRAERGLIVMPIYYDVEPSEVRKQKGNFGKAFTQQEAQNINKAKLWREALVDASNISGWVPKNIANGHESELVKKIVDTILDRLYPLSLDVDEHLVGMRAHFQKLETILDMRSGGVRMVGIWGVGGSGKTTLAYSLYKKISKQFFDHCFLENVREKTSQYGLEKLQGIILSALWKEKMEVHSVQDGMGMLKRTLYNRKVLLVLDDVDTLGQLEALAGKHEWFGTGSRIIITTRDEHLLITHRIDQVYPMTLLSDVEAIQLFKRHAYNEKDPVEDYDTLSVSVISYAAGLPLALKVLGSFLYDKDKNEWLSTLDRLKDIPEREIVEKLKISYDGLKTDEKELFLDIACFFRHGRTMGEVMEIFEACGFHPKLGIKVLIQKALISIVEDVDLGGVFDMHDLIQEMGHYIVRGEHPNNPEKHNRVWKQEEIEEMCFQDATMKNDKIEAIKYESSLPVCKLVSNMKKLRWLSVSTKDQDDQGPNFFSNELRYIHWHHYPARSPFPNGLLPMKLVVLNLRNGKQIKLWSDDLH